MLLTYIALLQPPSRSRHHTLYLAGIKANHRSFRSTEHGNGGMRAVDLERQYRVLTGKDTRYSKLGPSNPHLKVKTTQRQIMTENPVPNRTLEDDLQIELCQHVFKGPVSASRAINYGCTGLSEYSDKLSNCIKYSELYEIYLLSFPPQHRDGDSGL
jgi:hypothetical protein